MPDLADDIFDGEFDVAVSYTPEGGSPVTVRAIIAEGSNPGRESGKGLTGAVRGVEARHSRIYLQISEVATAPPVHSTITDENSIEWDIIAAERSRAGTWLCNAKTAVNKRRNK